MKSELNNYGIKNPDGMIRNRFNEVRNTFANDGRRFVGETPLRGQREVNKTAENFDFRKTPQKAAAPTGQPSASTFSDLQTAADQTFAASSSAATAASETAAASASATATATGTASAAGAAAAGATAATATVATGAATAAGAIAATVATAALVVAVFVSTLAINLSLLLAGMTSLIFRVDMTGAQDEDFETPIYATITDGDEYFAQQQVYRDTLLLTFEGLEPGTEYTVTVKNEEKIFFEKTYVTATEEVERGFLSAWNEGNEIFIIVEGVILADKERFTVTAKDDRGNVIFARDGVEEFAEYSFKLDKPRNLFFTLLVGGEVAAATEIRMPEFESEYDFENAYWSWSDDGTYATVSFGNFFGGEPLQLTAEITENVDLEPTCETEGQMTCYARATIGDRDYSDERTVILPALGHEYTAEFEWVEGGDDTYVAAGAVLTCSHNPDHTLTLEATLTRQEFDATCSDDAYVVYTATVEQDGETFEDTRTKFREGTALGHEYPDLYSDEPDESAFEITRNEIGEVTAATVTLTCLRCKETHTIPATEIERMTYDCNVCEDTEAEYYLFWDSEGIMEYAKYVTVSVTPTGHDYTHEFDWIKNQDGWYDGVNLVMTCSRDPSHVVEVEATMEEIGNTEATCEDPATTTYRATAEYDGVTYTDERTLEWEYSALGHQFESVYENEPDESAFHYTYNANGEIVDATMTLVCQRCHESVTMHATEIEVMSSEENLCEEGGEAWYYLFWDDGHDLEYSRYETATVGPLGHDYYEPTFMWNQGGDDTYVGATAIFTCRHNSEHMLELEATMETDEYEANCLNDAYTFYTVTVEYEGETYTDQRRVDHAGTALGHDYPEPDPDEDVDGVTYEYTYSDAGEIIGATMTRVCARCGEEETREATVDRMVPEFLDVCEYDGSAEYYLFWDGIEFSKYVTVTITPLGHDYGEPEFDWIEGGDDTYEGATAYITCSRDEDHVVELEATMTEEYHGATCLNDAYTLYTATVEWENETYTDTRTVTEEETATGHEFPQPDPDEDVDGVTYEYTYSDAGEITGATMTLVCTVCGEEETYEASIIEPDFIDLCEGGSVQYYIYWDEMEFSKYVTVTITPQGHDYLEDHFEWYEDGEGGYTAELILVCSRNPDHIHTVEATVTKEGDIFTATATYGEDTYTDTRTDPTGG